MMMIVARDLDVFFHNVVPNKHAHKKSVFRGAAGIVVVSLEGYSHTIAHGN